MALQHAAVIEHHHICLLLHYALNLLCVVQGQWVLLGGDPHYDVCRLYLFVFDTLSWSKADLSGKPLQFRMSYMATCHQAALVVMGGRHPNLHTALA